jgi:hypothetical protein
MGPPGDGDQMPKAAGCQSAAIEAARGESAFAPTVARCHKGNVGWGCAPLVAALASFVTPSLAWAHERQSTDDTVVPADLAEAVVGRWHLGEGYIVVLSRRGKGLRVHEEADVRVKGKVTRDSSVEYDPVDHLLHFPGLGAIHSTIITLRRSDGALEYSFRSELSPGKWTAGPWEKARRD